MRRGWLAFLAGTVLGLGIGLLARLPNAQPATPHGTQVEAAFRRSQAHAQQVLGAYQAAPSFGTALAAAQAYCRVMEVARQGGNDAAEEEARRVALGLASEAVERAGTSAERREARNVMSRTEPGSDRG